MTLQFIRKNVNEIVKQIKLSISNSKVALPNMYPFILDKNGYNKFILSDKYFGIFCEKEKTYSQKPVLRYDNFLVFKMGAKIYHTKKIVEQYIKTENGKVISEKTDSSFVNDEELFFNKVLTFHYSDNPNIINQLTEQNEDLKYCYVNFKSLISLAFKELGDIYLNDVCFNFSYGRSSPLEKYTLSIFSKEHPEQYHNLKSKVSQLIANYLMIDISKVSIEMDKIQSFVKSVNRDILDVFETDIKITTIDLLDFLKNSYYYDIDECDSIKDAYDVVSVLDRFCKTERTLTINHL